MDSHSPSAAADPRRRLALVAAVYLGSFIATLDVSIVNVALPTLQRALATDLGPVNTTASHQRLGRS